MVSSPILGDDVFFDAAEISRVFSQKDTGRMLLIGFEDQHINRIQNVTSSYRRRGNSYQSSTWSKRITTQIAEDYSLQKLTEWPMTEVGIHCVVFFVPDDQSVEKTIAILSQDQRAQIVQKMHQFKTRSHSYNDPYYKLQSNMHNMQIDLAHKIATGKNVTIAMIDSGVDIEHPDLKGQVEFNGNYTPRASSSFLNDIHGTAVAGVLVAHSDNGKGIIGIAPNAKLIVLKACWPTSTHSDATTCNSLTLALAVNTAIKLGAKVLNMSLAGPHDPLLKILLNKAIKKGMIVIAADSTNKKDKNRFPASLKNVISVQTLQHTSSRNKNNHSIIAPGENVLTTIPFGTYDFFSGSSIAAAQVSGIVALLLELKPDLTLSKAKKILFNSILNSYSENNKKSSYAINANAAVMQMCKKKICPQHF
jgi:hypothetical protein